MTRWLAQTIDGDTARRSLSRTPLKTVYESCVRPLGGPESNTDRKTFWRGAITGEAYIWEGEPGTPSRRRVSPVPGRIILGERPVGEITIEVVEEWADSLRRTGLGPSTIAKWGRHLSQTMEWARVRGYIAVNPVDAAVLVPRGAVVAARPDRYFLTLEEMVRLVQATPIEWRSLMHLLQWSGLRQGEARALRPESMIYRPGCMVHVTNSVVNDPQTGKSVLGRTKTESSERRAAIPMQVAVLLREEVLGAEIPNGRPLFPGASDDEWLRGDTLNDRFRIWCQDAGLNGNPTDRLPGRRKPPTPHDLRATGASILFAAGATVPEVQAWLGHASPQLTLRLYTETAGWGEEDPILAGLRGQGLTVPEILNAAFEEAWIRYGEPSDREWWALDRKYV